MSDALNMIIHSAKQGLVDIGHGYSVKIEKTGQNFCYTCLIRHNGGIVASEVASHASSAFSIARAALNNGHGAAVSRCIAEFEKAYEIVETIEGEGNQRLSLWMWVDGKHGCGPSDERLDTLLNWAKWAVAHP